MTALLVEKAGARSLLQDAGRPGLAHLGVSAGGAYDRAAWALGNRLLGNEVPAVGPGPASVEVLMGQLAVRPVGGDLLVCVTGAECPLTVDGRAVALVSPVLVRDGQLLQLGAPVRGLRSYLAVRGALDGERAFGSLSTNPTTGMGPKVLADGDQLGLGAAPGGTLASSDLAVTSARASDELLLGATWGPRDDWFTPAGRAVFASTRYQVTSEADRVGTRLSGPVLERAVDGELASEAVVRGSVQVPTQGTPLVFGPDHPTTGGYPVIAVLDPADADRLAQARPGTGVRFAPRRRRLEL